jgi:3-phenylpropionate/trans-cinnamate dioxygenase ferredoxin subunit
MGDFVEAGKTGEFQDGTRKKLMIREKEILLVRVKDEYYACSNRCTHMGGDLSEGSLEGTVVTCPRHASQFDIRDGKVVRWLKGPGLLTAVGKALKSPKPLETYPVKVEGDAIFVKI